MFNRAEILCNTGVFLLFSVARVIAGQHRDNSVSHFEASNSPAVTSRPPHLRSRVTNGRTVFAVGGDGKSAWTRRWKDLVEAHTNDCGGASRLTEAKLSLCRRAATLTVQLEQLEAQMSEGKDVDLASYAMVASHLRRILDIDPEARTALVA